MYHRSDVDYSEVYKHFKSATPDSVFKVPKEEINTGDNKPVSYSFAK